MSKRSVLIKFYNELPSYVYDHIETAYTGESINTQIGYCIDIKTFFEFLLKTKLTNIEDISQITTKHLEQVTIRDLTSYRGYLSEYESEYLSASGKVIKIIRKNSAFGINRKLSGIRGLFSYLYKHDLISQNVTDKLDFQKLHQKIKKPLTTQETLKFLDVLYNGENYYDGRELTEYTRRRQRDIALFITYLGTGCRVSELLNLNINDVDFDNFSFIVTRKGGDQQEIFMPVKVHEELDNYFSERLKYENIKDTDALFINRQGKRMTVAGVEKLLKKYFFTVGVTNADKTRPHALRRTFACNLLADGIDIKMVADLMGHKNIDVTHKYYAQYTSRKRKEIMQDFKVVDENRD